MDDISIYLLLSILFYSDFSVFQYNQSDRLKALMHLKLV